MSDAGLVGRQLLMRRHHCCALPMQIGPVVRLRSRWTNWLRAHTLSSGAVTLAQKPGPSNARTTSGRTSHDTVCVRRLCRLFLSAEPPPALERGLPINLLQNSIKLTNEPPEGLRPNLIRAFNSFNEEMLESCAKQVRLS